MSYPAYPLPAGTHLPTPTETDNGTRDIAFVAGRLSAGEPYTVITLHRGSVAAALDRIQAAGGSVPYFREDEFDRQNSNESYAISVELAEEWNKESNDPNGREIIKKGGVA